MKRILIVALMASFLLFAACQQAPAEQTVQLPDEVEPEPSLEEAQPDVVIEVTGENFAFFQDGVENPTLTVQQGDLVRVEFTSTQGFHDFVIDEFDAATEQVSADQGTVAVEFVADQAGEFAYYCSVGAHRAQGMVGNFVVE